jgi:hypothetical protein
VVADHRKANNQQHDPEGIAEGLKATHCLSDVMRELKKNATNWVHEELRVKDFAWQEGYAAFTVSPRAKPQVSQYLLGRQSIIIREDIERNSFRCCSRQAWNTKSVISISPSFCDPFGIVIRFTRIPVVFDHRLFSVTPTGVMIAALSGSG